MRSPKVVQQLVTIRLLILFRSTVSAEDCKCSKVPKVDLAEYDAEVDLLPAQ